LVSGLRAALEAEAFASRGGADALRALRSWRERLGTEVRAGAVSVIGGSCYPWHGGQRSSHEGASHPPERLAPRDSAASKALGYGVKALLVHPPHLPHAPP
jgi:hypothetical protein